MKSFSDVLKEILEHKVDLSPFILEVSSSHFAFPKAHGMCLNDICSLVNPTVGSAAGNNISSKYSIG